MSTPIRPKPPVTGVYNKRDSCESLTEPGQTVRLRRGIWRFHMSILCASVLILFAAAVLHVRGQREVVVPLLDRPLPGVCTFQRMTGYDCPGCGLTRSVISIAHGRWWQALAFNPAGVVFFALIAFQLPYRVLQLVRIHRGLEAHHFMRLDQWVVLGLTTVLLIQWLVKLAARSGTF